MARKQTGEKILQAARRALVAGDGSIEMNHVAKKAGVSVGLAYHYYGSKAGMLVAIIKDFYRRYLEIANKRYDGNIPWHVREKERLSSLVTFLYTDPLAPIVLGKMAQSAEVITVESEGQSELIKLASKNIEDGQKRGQISPTIDPAIAGAAIMGAMRQSVTYVMATEERPTADTLTEQLWHFIAGALNLRENSAQ